VASTPDQPITPRRKLTFGAALFGALLVGSLAALGLERLDNTVSSAEQLGELGLPLLGALPSVPGAQDQRRPPDRHVLDYPTAPFALAVGALRNELVRASAELFRWIGTDLHESLAPTYDELNRAGDQIEGVQEGSQLEFLTRTSLDAQIASDQIRNAVRIKPLVQDPRSGLANQLQMIASMIRAELPTRVYYASLGGFDTHAGQANSHANLMTQLSAAVLAFQKDLKAQANDTRVLTMTFSEFGRRVKQNGSAGTDHGTAAPMFLMGPMVRPGILGDHPSLTDLDNGDLKFNVDFRSVYSAILEDWLKADSKKILKGEFRPAKIFNKTV
jgi:uncharacterized protein (DUF1501 family)